MSKFPDPRNRGYTNRDIATMALYLLGGALRHVHLEDVAMKAVELSPKKFRWKKYPEQINLESVRVTLKDESSLVNRRVMGGIRDGWMLTPSGLSWCIATAGVSVDQALIDQLHLEVDRAKKTTAFRKATDGRGQDVSNAEVETLLRINEYFTDRDRRERALALANAAVLDSQLHSVLSNLKERGFDKLEVKK